VAKLLYVSQRARPDIALLIAFLCTRVTRCTTEDEGKILRVLHFLNGTLDDELILSADQLGTLTTWVNASYAVHQDMKSHTGACQSLGRGVFHACSIKQKLNTKSSTETELVGALDYLPFTLWTMRFLEAQGHPVDWSIYHQDNESAIQLENNGVRSAGSKLQHIHIGFPDQGCTRQGKHRD